MAGGIGDAFVNVRADTTTFARDLDKGVTKSTKGATRAMGGLATATGKVEAAARQFIGLYLGVQGLRKVKAFIDESIEANTNLVESINATNVVFGDSADEILKIGESAAQTRGIAESEFNQMSVSFANFARSISEQSGRDIVGIIDELTLRATDFASVMNIDVADANEKFRSGLAGQSRPLREFNIDVSDAAITMFALENNIGTAGDELTQQEKVLARYGSIMEQTDNLAGDFERTIEDLANSTRVATAEIENNKARTGELLVPIKRLTTAVSTLAVEGFALLATKILGATGMLDPHLAQLQEYEIQAGAGTDATTLLAGAVLKASQDLETQRDSSGRVTDATEAMTEEILGLVGATDLSAEEAQNLIDKMDFMTETMGLSEDAALILTDALENKLALAQADAEHAAADSILTYQSLETTTGDLELATGDLADEEDELAEKVKTTSELLQERQDQIRANLDPLFALSEATRKQAEAQEAFRIVSENANATDEERAIALENLFEANLNLSESEDSVRVNTDLTREAFINQAISIGHTIAEAEELAKKFSFLEAFKFTNKTIRISDISTSQVAVSGRQHGGPVSAGTPYTVGEVGPEIFVPKVAGNIIPNDQITSGGVTVGSINVSFSGGGATQADANMVADAIEDRLVKLSRARVVR